MKPIPAGKKICEHQRKNIPRKFTLKHSMPGRKIFLEKKFLKKIILEKYSSKICIKTFPAGEPPITTLNSPFSPWHQLFKLLSVQI